MSLLFKFRPLMVNPKLAERIGLNEAIVLQQLNYWIIEKEVGIEHEGRRWVYNTLDQWREQFPFWSVDTVKRALSSLGEMGIVLVEQLKKSRHDRTNFYTINYEHIALIEEGNLHPSKEGNLPSSIGADSAVLTETTTKTTTKTTAKTSAKKTKRTCAEDTDFEEAWKAYPKREGSNPKNAALKAWNARLKEKCLPQDMIAGAMRYHAYCAAKGNINTEYVMQAQRFFGRSREFENEWRASAVPGRQQKFDPTEYVNNRNRSISDEQPYHDPRVIDGEAFRLD